MQLYEIKCQLTNQPTNHNHKKTPRITAFFSNELDEIFDDNYQNQIETKTIIALLGEFYSISIRKKKKTNKIVIIFLHFL